MRYLRGFTKRYFSLAIIAVYSTLYRLYKIDANYKYHKISHKEPPKSTSPPYLLLAKIKGDSKYKN
jgi:hypothetical protein